MIDSLISKLYAFKNQYLFWLDVPRITLTDIIEIIILAILFYALIVWMKKTRSWALLKGLIIIFAFVMLAAIFQMSTILWLAAKILNYGVIAVIVIFAPELRRALESLGRSRIFKVLFNPELLKNSTERFSLKTEEDIVKACFDMGKVRTGALIVIERDGSLSDYEATGISLDSKVSYQLIVNIFEKNTPLHDGAVIVRGDRIVSATCYLPLTDNRRIPKELGTRHRAALGISEVSDSLTLVVSEETGEVSCAFRGNLVRGLKQKDLIEKLESIRKYKDHDKEGSSSHTDELSDTERMPKNNEGDADEMTMAAAHSDTERKPQKNEGDEASSAEAAEEKNPKNGREDEV